MNSNILIKDFENKSLEKRINFIEVYDFDNDIANKNYFIDFIIESTLTRNNWYNILIIELAERYQVINNSLLLKYIEYLRNSNYYLLKLAILDYLTITHSFYSKKDFNFSIILQTKVKNRHIVTNQILLFLILVDIEKYDKYIQLFLINFDKTLDYRSHIRTYNFIEEYLISVLNKETIFKIIKCSESKKMGRAVDLAIKSILSFY